jgi:hypothetical protein
MVGLEQAGPASSPSRRVAVVEGESCLCTLALHDPTAHGWGPNLTEGLRQ